MKEKQKPTASPLNSTAPAELATKPSALSTSEALAVLQYLTTRKVLCDLCGYRLVTKENQVYAVCNECAPTLNQNFTPRLRKAGHLDVFLCKKLTEWTESVFQGDGQASGGTACN